MSYKETDDHIHIYVQVELFLTYNYYQGAYFVGGFGAALMDAIDVEKMSDEELVKYALQKGFKIEDYIISKRK